MPFQYLQKKCRKEILAENTYLLTLDGDIDFQPEAVTLLVDLMKKNKMLGNQFHNFFFDLFK